MDNKKNSQKKVSAPKTPVKKSIGDRGQRSRDEGSRGFKTGEKGKIFGGPRNFSRSSEPKRAYAPRGLSLPHAFTEQVLRTAYKLRYEKEAPLTLSNSDLGEKLLREILKKQNTLNHLWDAFTTHREELGLKLLSKPEVVFCYLLGFHSGNAIRLINILERLNKRGFSLNQLIANSDRIMLTDFGAGTGSMSHGFISYCHSAITTYKGHITAHLIDQNRQLLHTARALIERVSTNVQVKNHNFLLQDLNLNMPQWQNLVEEDNPNQIATSSLRISFFGYLLNEIRKNSKAQKKIFTLLETWLSSNHLFFVVEPGEESSAYATMDLRENLCQMGYIPIYPCPHYLPCPLMDSHKDWCFSETAWQKPVFQRKIDSLLEVSRDILASAAYAFISPSLQKQMQLEKKKSENIVVGRPVNTLQHQAASTYQRDFSYLLCTSKGEKLQVPSSRAVEKIMRGDNLP